MSTTNRNGRVAYACRGTSMRPGFATTCPEWSVCESELLPRICSKLVETVDGELLKALAARPPAADRLSDLDALRRHMADLEKQIDEAADRYLKAPVELMPRLEERLQVMRQELADCEKKAQLLSAQANEGAVANFARWWEKVRSQHLLIRVAPPESGDPDTAAAALIFWQGIRQNARPEDAGDRSSAEGPDPEDNFALVEPAALRGLLVRLGVKVECSFAKADSIKKKTPGSGRGPSYILRRAVFTMNADGCVHRARLMQST